MRLHHHRQVLGGLATERAACRCDVGIIATDGHFEVVLTRHKVVGWTFVTSL